MNNVLSVGTTNSRLLQIEARTFLHSPMVETVIGPAGPETRPSAALCPPDGDWVGIHFKHGVFMPHLPVGELATAQ